MEMLLVSIFFLEDPLPFGKVCAPTQVLDAVPETFFSALRNSA
jgi:hypothetical protein